MKTLKFSHYTISLTHLVIVTIAFIILLTLGFWQLERLGMKNAFLEAMNNNISGDAVDYKLFTQDNIIYKKIKMNGRFLVNQDIHLYGRKSASSTEKDGYYLITPFQTKEGAVIMVARGWFSSRNKNIIYTTAEDHDHEITGVALPLEKAKLFVPANDIKNNIWFILNLQEISQLYQSKLENFYIILDGKTGLKEDILKPLSITNLANVRNDHLEYAFTWFGLALALVVIFIIYCKNKTHDQ